jgi:U-box domain
MSAQVSGVIYAALVSGGDSGAVSGGDKMLSQSLKDKLQPWTDSTLEGKVNRVAKYIQEEPQKTLKGVGIGMGTIGTGALIGGAIGGVVGFAVANVPGIPLGIAIGGGIGAGVGLFAGATAGAVMNRNEYIQWKRHCRYEDLLQELMTLHQEDPSLKAYECPLTFSLFEDPVMIASGTVYERSAIAAYIKQGGGETMEPLRSRIIKEEDLYEDHATRGVILVALESLFRKGLSNHSLSDDQRKGMDGFLRDLDIQIKTAESLGRKVIKRLRKEKKLTANVYKKYQDKLNGLIRD